MAKSLPRGASDGRLEFSVARNDSYRSCLAAQFVVAAADDDDDAGWFVGQTCTEWNDNSLLLLHFLARTVLAWSRSGLLLRDQTREVE